MVTPQFLGQEIITVGAGLKKAVCLLERRCLHLKPVSQTWPWGLLCQKHLMAC